jgi:Protein of unknown function (DUF3305)
MERSVRIQLGVVVERRRSRSPWQEWIWRPVSVILGAPALGSEWRELMHGEGWTQYHAANLPLELHRAETEAYRVNLAQRPPRVFVVLRPATGPGPHAYRPHLVTASPQEAEGYLESGDEIVEGVAMPDALIAWLRAFVERHHVEQPFIKRKRAHKGGARREDGSLPDPAARKKVFDG